MSRESSALQGVGAFVAVCIALFVARRSSPRASVSQSSFSELPYVLRSTRVVHPDGFVGPADIVVDERGVISSVRDAQPIGDAEGELFDVGSLVIMPGLIDPHVHINSPGRTDWEGFDSATRAAAAGGTTSILDMPLNNVPSTVSVDALMEKVMAFSEARPVVDVGFVGGVIPDNVDNLGGLLNAGVVAFKSFMVDSQSADFPHVVLEDLANAMAEIRDLGLEQERGDTMPPYILHAELVPEDYNPELPYPGDDSSYSAYLASRPEDWETSAVARALEFAEITTCRIHIAHVSSSKAAHLIAEHRSNTENAYRNRVTAETCPQYLLWSAEEVRDGQTEFKCAPPIRPKNNQELLWRQLVGDGPSAPALDMVVSDHSPALPSLKKLKEGDLRGAWGGIAGLQYRLQATWTAMEKAGVPQSLSQISRWLSSGPAEVFGLAGIKGSIKPGLHADFVIWNPEESSVIKETGCLHRHTFSPFVGMNLTGIVHWTLVRGRVAFSSSPSGEMDSSSELSSQGRVLVRQGPSENDVVSEFDPEVDVWGVRSLGVQAYMHQLEKLK